MALVLVPVLHHSSRVMRWMRVVRLALGYGIARRNHSFHRSRLCPPNLSKLCWASITMSNQPIHSPCPNCGKPLEVDSPWCPNCAKRQQVESNQVQVAKKRQTSILVLLILANILGLPLVICGGCILSGIISDAASNPQFMVNATYVVTTVAAGGLIGYALIKWRAK